MPYSSQLIHQWDATEVDQTEEILNDEEFLNRLNEEYEQWMDDHEKEFKDVD